MTNDKPLVGALLAFHGYHTSYFLTHACIIIVVAEGLKNIEFEIEKMTNREQIQRDIVIALDFTVQIIDNPSILDKIPEGVAITFQDDENVKPEQREDKRA